MPEPLRLFLDQCLRVEVALALRREGHDAQRAAEVGQHRADDLRSFNAPYPMTEFSSPWTSISGIGRFCLFGSIPALSA